MSSSLLDSLNEAQQQAVRATSGPVLVLAGPGSGKTRLLTHRVAYLIEEVGVDPFHILAVTFTNRAAREMRERLEDLIGPRHAALTVGTFHSLCARFLRRDSVHLGRERDFAIYDADDQQRLIRRVLRDLNLDDKKHPPRAILATISSAKNELVDVQEYARFNRDYYDEIVTRCYERYQALLLESNALDFDDLLFETVRLFEQHPDVLARYHKRYRYLLVDEYQDTNRAQYVLVRQLASGHRNLFVVGDDDQSIYAWRGADIRNILQFEDDYPDAQIFLLEQNYRSTRSILDIAHAVISGSARRKRQKQLWTQNEQGTEVSLIEGYDQEDEAQRVADEIARFLASDTYATSDIAIMYRTNAQSRVIEEALMRRAIAYRVVGGMRFYERKEVKDMLAYLRVIANPADSVSLERIINVPRRGIGSRTVSALSHHATEQGLSLYHALRALAEADDPVASPVSGRAHSALVPFFRLIEKLVRLKAVLNLTDLFDAVLEQISLHEVFVQEYGPEEATRHWENVQELREVADEYTGLERETQLPTFLEEVALVQDVDSLEQQNQGVTCITLHQAKGLEYAVVFLVGLEEGLLPHNRSLDELDKLDEERRLFYVGATRARERLYLLYAFRRTNRGRASRSTPSRFLKDIPPELLKKPDRSLEDQPPAVARFGSPDRPVSISDLFTTSDQSPTSTSFGAGERVIHETFGQGVVISSRLVEGDEEVTVLFDEKGKKKLLASFARLRHLD